MTRPAALRLEDDAMCFACGPKNPIGLRLKFAEVGGGRVRTIWSPRREHQGFKDIVHGGLIATVLDEVMSRMLYARGVRAVTAVMETKFLKPVEWGKSYRFEAWVVRERSRAVIAEAEGMAAVDGGKVAWARGTFLTVG